MRSLGILPVKTKRKRIWREHAPGLYNTDAPYWQGERAEYIVKQRVLAARLKTRGKIRISFTGTRRGCTGNQRRRLKRWVNKLVARFGAKNILWVHGACKGADYEFHMTVLRAGGLFIEVWPSFKLSRVERLKRFTKQHYPDVKLTIHRPQAPLDRNVLIVQKTFNLLACPKEEREATRSGTWSTVRLARKSTIPVRVIKP